jgi:hypothetical protein
MLDLPESVPRAASAAIRAQGKAEARKPALVALVRLLMALVRLLETLKRR